MKIAEITSLCQGKDRRPLPFGKIEWPPHVWVGTSVENQSYADERIPVLVSAAARAKIRFLSCEPLLGPVDLSPWLFPGPGGGNCSSPLERGMVHEPGGGSVPSLIEWVICGGESGPQARPTHPAWARSLGDQCGNADVPFSSNFSAPSQGGFRRPGCPKGVKLQRLTRPRIESTASPSSTGTVIRTMICITSPQRVSAGCGSRERPIAVRAPYITAAGNELSDG
jgi:hypothetical protein